MRTFHIALVTILGLVFTLPVLSDEPAPNTPEKPAKANVSATAENAVGDFLLGMMSNDEAAVRKVILPNPNAEILWHGDTVPPQAIARMKNAVTRLTCRDVKAGETVRLPGGRQFAATATWVNSTHKLVFPTIEGQEMALPLALVLVEGQWKVDAGAIIAGRLAAKRAQENAAAQGQPGSSGTAVPVK